jgi:two-component system, cell cycle sensor histidine kinase and response regulator CckA
MVPRVKAHDGAIFFFPGLSTMMLSTLKKSAIGLALVGVLLLLASAVAYQGGKWSLESSFLVSHTHEVLQQLNETRADLALSRTASREYFFTQEPSSLEDYQVAVSRLRFDLERLAQLTADNPTQRLQLSTLQSQLKKVMELLDETVASREQKGADSGRQLAYAFSGRELVEKALATIGSMESEENRLLQGRKRVLDRSIRGAEAACAIAVLVQLVLLAMIFYVIHRELLKREQTERALRDSEERFRLLVSGVTD